MNSRERVQAALSFEEAGRIPVHDDPWPATIERWRQEGLPRNIDPAEYFGYEIICFQADTSPRFPVKVLEEDEEYIVETTPFGGVVRNHKLYTTTPEIIDYPCKSRSDWERIKERLVPSRERVDWRGEWKSHKPGGAGEGTVLATGRADLRIGLDGNRQAKQDDMFICFKAWFGYDKLHLYLSAEQALIAMIDDPEWVRDVYETDVTLIIEICDIMRQGGFYFDGAFLCCDLGYRNDLLFSPRHYEEQLRPAFRRLLDYFDCLGMPVILHSDGCVRKLIPYFVEDGVSCLQPLEVKAGMDLVALKEQWGDKLAFMGGIDVRAMADEDPAAIENEIRSKIPFAKRRGGYIYHSDHSVPNDVSFSQYQRVLELVQKYGSY
jgi:uroporphyrinogen decarboxylase